MNGSRIAATRTRRGDSQAREDELCLLVKMVCSS